MKRYSVLILLILLTGCMRAEVRNEQFTVPIGTPYRKVLVCVISPDPARVAQMETIVTERLRRSHILVEKGADVFVSAPEGSPERVLANIQQDFDAVLVIKRKNGQAFSRLQELVKAYEAGVATGQDTPGPLQVVISLIGVRENQVVWSMDGILEGDQDAPAIMVMQAFARAIVSELNDAGFVQRKWAPKSRDCPAC